MLLSLDVFPLYLNNESPACIPRTHRAVVTFTNKKIQFINLQTFTQDDKLITIPNSTDICGITATSDNIIVGDKGRIHCLDIEGTYLRTITLSQKLNTLYLSIGHNNQIYYSTVVTGRCYAQYNIRIRYSY
jgi:hypothetical protein